MSLLGQLYESQFVDDDANGIAKEASAHGMTPQEYMAAIARQEAESEEIAKVAAENEIAKGILVSEGLQQGIRDEFSKMASMGGDARACTNLVSLFVK